MAAALTGLLLAEGASAQDVFQEVRQLSDLVTQLRGQGRYAEAIEPARRLLSIREEVLGPEDPITASSLNDLALLYGRIGQYALALPLYQRALEAYEKARGPDDPGTAVVLSKLADSYYGTGQYAQALPLYQRALAIREKVLGREHPDTADSLNDLADFYVATGRYAQAQPLYQRALAIQEKALGPEHADVANSLNNLGRLHHTTGQYAQALPLFQRALAIREKVLGTDHPLTAIVLNNLAETFRTTGQYAQALPLYQRALAIDEKALGPEHPGTASSLNNLAGLYRITGQDTQALPLLQRALEIKEKVLGPEHPDTAQSLNNLAVVYAQLGRHVQALPLYQRALAITEKALGPDHPLTSTGLSNLALQYQETGQPALALPLYERALAIREKALGPDHPDTALSLFNLAMLDYQTGQDARALLLQQRALRAAIAAGAPDLLWQVHGSLMWVYAPQGTAAAGRAQQVALAIWHGKQAVNALQKVSTGLRDVDAQMQRSFLKNNVWYYTRLADLLVQEGRIAEAEQVLAMLKERELSDLVHRSDVRKTQADEVGVERRASREIDELATRGAKYSSELAALERKARLERLSAAETARKDELLKAGEAWRGEYQRWIAGLAELFTQSGASRAEAQGQGAQGTRLQTLVRAEPGAVGLHYVVTDQRIAIVVATARGSFGRFSEVGRAELNRRIAALRQAIVSRADVLPAAQALYKVLIAPVAQDLEEAQATTLVLSLTDTLRYVPFAALHDGRNFLIERHPLALYASAGGAQPHAGGQAWRVAALGLTLPRLGFNPLPAVKGELEGIVRTEASPQGVLPGRIALDQDFDRAQLQDALLGGYSVVHVASHFSFTPGDESRSVLLPGAGEPISLGQLAVMDFSHVQQLTLSACETATGGGADENGAEVEGLAAAVQAQGAQAVLASLWKVADASTAQLMQRFYAQRAQGQNLTRAIALQQAQLALLNGESKDDSGVSKVERSARRDAPSGTDAAPVPVDSSKPYAHPFYWAPFVLSGNWL